MAAPGQIGQTSSFASYSELSSEQRYVLTLSDKARIRLAALAQVSGVDHGWVEWIDSSNEAIETLDLKQLSALGFEVSVHPYGVRLAARNHVLVRHRVAA